MLILTAIASSIIISILGIVIGVIVFSVQPQYKGFVTRSRIAGITVVVFYTLSIAVFITYLNVMSQLN